MHWSIFGNVINQPITQKLRRKKLNSIRIIINTYNYIVFLKSNTLHNKIICHLHNLDINYIYKIWEDKSRELNNHINCHHRSIAKNRVRNICYRLNEIFNGIWADSVFVVLFTLFIQSYSDVWMKNKLTNEGQNDDWMCS